jgi:hypothetical protein
VLSKGILLEYIVNVQAVLDATLLPYYYLLGVDRACRKDPFAYLVPVSQNVAVPRRVDIYLKVRGKLSFAVYVIGGMPVMDLEHNEHKRFIVSVWFPSVILLVAYLVLDLGRPIYLQVAKTNVLVGYLDCQA